MMRTLGGQRCGGHGHAGREYLRGGTPGTRSAPPPQRPSSGRRRQPQQFFAPTARSSTAGFQHLAANPPWLLRYDLLAAARGCQRPLGQADQNFLRRCSAPTALNRRDDPNLIRRIPLPTGRPGPVGSGAVSSRSPNSADRGQAFKRLAQYLIPWVWRACHYSAIFLIRRFFAPC
jgi:hypothetical protein